MIKFLKKLTRRKVLNDVASETTQLRKTLSTLDLVALGVGCTLGVGVYVLPGVVARELAGPGVVVSFLLAALTSIIAGVCFAEFGARVPRSGSAYTYSYVTIGEFVAFTIGWNLILEYIIGSASVARGLSVYIDTMTGNKMEAFYRSLYEFHRTKYLSPYFDLFSFGISILVTIGLAVGLKQSLIINNLLTFVNVSVVIFVIVIGSFKMNIHNWNLAKYEVPKWAGDGGFFPFGLIGTIKGASTCFYGYVGFDVIATSGEEVKDPQKSIPLSIIFSLAIIFLSYFGLSAVLTLMVPYYAQDIDAPIPSAFVSVHWDWAAWIVAIGGIFGLLASLFSGMFPLPRIIYAMANDGLMFKWLGMVSTKFGTPFTGTLVAGLLTALMSACFELKQLIDLMSIGTLLAYAIVSACVLLLRYRPADPDQEVRDERTQLLGHSHLSADQVTWSSILVHMFNHRDVSKPTRLTSAVAATFTLLFSVFSTVLAYILVEHESNILHREHNWIIVSIALLNLLMVLCMICIGRQPSDTANLKFKVPFLPLIPCISIFMNVYLMMIMDAVTWTKFLIWMVGGYVIYFCYGISSSVENGNNRIGYQRLDDDSEVEQRIGS